MNRPVKLKNKGLVISCSLFQDDVVAVAKVNNFREPEDTESIAERLVTCYNLFSGIVDPEAEMQRLRKLEIENEALIASVHVLSSKITNKHE